MITNILYQEQEPYARQTVARLFEAGPLPPHRFRDQDQLPQRHQKVQEAAKHQDDYEPVIQTRKWTAAGSTQSHIEPEPAKGSRRHHQNKQRNSSGIGNASHHQQQLQKRKRHLTAAQQRLEEQKNDYFLSSSSSRNVLSPSPPRHHDDRQRLMSSGGDTTSDEQRRTHAIGVSSNNNHVENVRRSRSKPVEQLIGSLKRIATVTSQRQASVQTLIKHNNRRIQEISKTPAVSAREKDHADNSGPHARKAKCQCRHHQKKLAQDQNPDADRHHAHHAHHRHQQQPDCDDGQHRHEDEKFARSGHHDKQVGASEPAWHVDDPRYDLGHELDSHYDFKAARQYDAAHRPDRDVRRRDEFDRSRLYQPEENENRRPAHYDQKKRIASSEFGQDEDSLDGLGEGPGGLGGPLSPSGVSLQTNGGQYPKGTKPNGRQGSTSSRDEVNNWNRTQEDIRIRDSVRSSNRDRSSSREEEVDPDVGENLAVGEEQGPNNSRQNTDSEQAMERQEGDLKTPATSKAGSKAGSRASSSKTKSRDGDKSTRSLNLNPFSGSLWERREPCVQLWVTLSAMYGKVLVLLMIAFCLIEVMDNKIKPLTFQAYFMMYLYIGSIIAIMCIYISVLLDNCPSLTNSRENLTAISDPEVGSIGSLGTLKRAHISRKKISRTSFYLRIGALVFGLGTLIFNGLEIAMHATMNDSSCFADIGHVVIAHPILQALFTFLQMHFLFVNSTVIVEKFGVFARFGFIHLVATNLSLWVRTIIWESASEWIDHLYKQQIMGFETNIRVPDYPTSVLERRNDGMLLRDRSLNDVGNYEFIDTRQLNAFAAAAARPGTCNNTWPVSQEHISQVISLYACFNDNELGRLWTSSMPYLFPFIVEFSLIAAAVTYIMWRSVGQLKIAKMEGKKLDEDNIERKRKGYWRVDCQSASKGLFLGLLTLVGGIIILIIFFVMKDTKTETDFHGLDLRMDSDVYLYKDNNPAHESYLYKEQMFLIYAGAEIVIFSLCIVASLAGFVQVQKLAHSMRVPYDLDNLLSTLTVTGSYIYAIFGILAAVGTIREQTSTIVFVQSALLLLQVTLQGMIISEANRRVCNTRAQQLHKPGRQIITFMLFANITLWIMDTFMSHRDITQEVQTGFYGLLAWGIISRISLPLLIFYRFHSCVVLVEIWKNTYRTKESL